MNQIPKGNRAGSIALTVTAPLISTITARQNASANYGQTASLGISKSAKQRVANPNVATMH